MNYIGHLPAEILSLILEQVNVRYLYACILVNKRFYSTAIPLLWGTLSVDTDEQAMTLTNCLLESPHGSHHVTHLYLGYFTMTDALLLQWMAHLPNLELLYVPSGDELSDTSMQHLGRSCPNLRTLQLHYSSMTQLSIRALGQHCHHLHFLDLYGCGNLSSDLFSALTLCPLKTVAFGMNFTFALDWMTAEETLVDLTKFNLLTDLVLTRASIPFIRQLLSTTTTAWPRLTRLVLQEYSDLGDKELVGFIKAHPSLQSLSLEDVDLTDVTLDAIATYLSHGVTYVNLGRNNAITQAGLRRMVLRCPKLTSVSIYGCDQTMADFPEVNAQCVETLVRRRPQQPHETVLHQLDQDTIKKIRLGQVF